jgi:hypothetical protein
MATGRPRGRVSDPKASAGAVAFALKGRALAWSDETSVHVTELATGKELRRFTGQGEIQEMSLADDGSLLVTRGADSTAIVWTLAGLEKAMRPRDATRRAEELDALWKGLADGDAAKAYQAVWALAESPGQAVALVRERVRPAGALAGAEAERLARLLAELDGEEFGRREKAAEDLARMGRAVEAAVRAELGKGANSEDVRRRLGQVLDKIERAELTGEALRPLRALELLEQVGTAEAREALAALAKGMAEARLTQEAKAAEARLAQRSPK